MNSIPQNRMALGVFLLFWTVCNGLFGTAGFALCLHELGAIHLMEEKHELEGEHCGQKCSPCGSLDETDINASSQHCLDINIEGELGEFMQGSNSLKATPPVVTDLVSILDAMPHLDGMIEEQGSVQPVDQSTLSVCKTPVLVTQTTVFRL